jgi:mono/diheme cytochrome c family protein
MPSTVCQPRFALLSLLAAALAGCSGQMAQQAKYTTMAPSEFYDDGASARPLTPGTIARGHLKLDSAFYQGSVDGRPVDQLPLPLTAELLARGQQRYNIYCSMCHGLAGDGDGVIVQRGFRPPSYHIARLRASPPGHIFEVIMRGFGVMPSLASQIEPADRWAIVAYVRALQLSQDARLDDVPLEEQARLEAAPPAGGKAPEGPPDAAAPQQPQNEGGAAEELSP